LEKLGLTEDIPYPVHISPTVLEKGLDHYFAYNVEDGAEIFLNQPLTINNLALNITRWLTEINQLKEKITNLEGEKITNQQTITELQTELDNLTNHITELGNLLTTERTNSQSEITNLKD
jgi:chromosome segregation ATPase